MQLSSTHLRTAETRVTTKVARPGDHGLTAWSCDPAIAQGTFTPAAGVLYVQRLWVRASQAVAPSNLWVIVSTGGTGGTALANCFVGIYDSAGQPLANGSSADQSTAFQTTGAKQIALAAQQQLTPGASYFAVLLIGTQSTTNVVFRATSSAAALNLNLSASALRGGSISSGLSALPLSFAPGSLAGVGTHWAGVS